MRFMVRRLVRPSALDRFGPLVSALMARVDIRNARRLSAVLKPGRVFLDVGANIGFFSLLGATLVARNPREHSGVTSASGRKT
jgi:hypothetical protein